MNEILSFTAKRIKLCPNKLLIAPTQTILRIIRGELKEIDQDLTQLQLIADSIPLYTSEKFSVLSPAVGMSTINLALQPLLVEKIKEVYLVSVAGAVNTNFNIGDIIQGERFVKENNESYLANSKLKGIKTARIFSVHSPYDENVNYNDCDLVDMEAAEVAKLCIQYDISFKTLFCVSDIWQDITNSENGKWKSGFGSSELNNALKNAVQIAINSQIF